MKYKGALLDLVKNMKPHAELEKSKIRMLVQNIKHIASFIGCVQASYVRLFSGLDVVVRTHQISLVGFLTKSKSKNQVWKEIKEYLEQLRHIATREDLELNKQNMQNFIGGPIQVKTMLFMLQNKLDTSFKTMYPYVVEARVHFQLDTITQFGEIITQYQAWHQYVTEKQQVEVIELDFSQTQAS